jgi:hypothetical protein
VKNIKTLLWLFDAIALLWIVLALNLQRSIPPRQALKFEPATVVTVSGTIRTVEQRDCSLTASDCRTTALGIHALLRTVKGLFDVHFGPASFLQEHHLAIKPGDQIEVTGSKIVQGLPVTLIASQVRKGGVLLRLRDSAGAPLWLDRHEPFN